MKQNLDNHLKTIKDQRHHFLHFLELRKLENKSNYENKMIKILINSTFLQID